MGLELLTKIIECSSTAELDRLRIEIVKDKENFLVLQKAFIKQQNKLKRKRVYG